MLNSVARYLWGSGSEDLEDVAAQVDCGDQGVAAQQEPVLAVPEAVQHAEDEDWVLVGLAGQDKENSSQPSQNSPNRHYHHHPHNFLHPHKHQTNRNNHVQQHPPPNHHHNHQQQQQSLLDAGSSLSQNSLCSGGADVEILDDAASLVHSAATGFLYENASGEGVVQEGHANILDIDSNYSSDTESSPDSVFSACSGRSHATYHPRGTGSEPWVIAPPPCFTGSQAGTLSPVAASPLENLLIEHPSMSVYLSVPMSQPNLLSTPHSTGDFSSSGVEDSSAGVTELAADVSAAPNGTSNTTTTATSTGSAHQALSQGNSLRQPCRNMRNSGMVHPEASTPQQLARITRAAQKLQCNQAQKVITAHHCERQNKVRDYQSHPKVKTNSRRQKNMQASGAKCSRFSQRM